MYPEDKHRYIEWCWNIVCWDGMLPFTVFAIPKVMMNIFPRVPGARELTFLIVPITAFVVRYFNGRMTFRSGKLYMWQLAIFFLAIFVLFVLDAMLVMVQIVRGPVPASAYQLMGAIYLAYLVLIGVALFPIRRQLADDVPYAQGDFQF